MWSQKLRLTLVGNCNRLSGRDRHSACLPHSFGPVASKRPFSFKSDHTISDAVVDAEREVGEQNLHAVLSVPCAGVTLTSLDRDRRQLACLSTLFWCLGQVCCS